MKIDMVASCKYTMSLYESQFEEKVANVINISRKDVCDCLDTHGIRYDINDIKTYEEKDPVTQETIIYSTYKVK